MHTFFFIDSVGTRMRVAALDPDSISKFLDSNPAAIERVSLGGDRWAFSAPSPALAAFIASYARRPGAVGAPSTWVKVAR